MVNEKIRAERILALVNTHLGIDLRDRNQNREYFIPRHVLMYIFTKPPFNLLVTEVGRILNRHHASVINGKKAVTNAIFLKDDISEKYKEYISKFEKMVNNYYGNEDVSDVILTQDEIDNKMQQAKHEELIRDKKILMLSDMVEEMEDENLVLKEEIEQLKKELGYRSKCTTKSPFKKEEKKKQEDNFTVAGIRYF